MKQKVQDLIKRGELIFEDEDISNINENPLSNHGGPKVNTVKSSQEMQGKRNVKDVRMPMKLVHEILARWANYKVAKRKKKKQKIKKNISISTMRALRIMLSKSVQISLS